MLRNYVVTALRVFRRQKSYALLNVLGLAVGLACAFFILLWVQDERAYDQFHENGDELFMARRHAFFTDGQIFTWSSVPQPASEALEAQFPEVVDAEMVSYTDRNVLAYGDRALREPGHYADPAFFDLFTFPFLEGDPATALDGPNHIVVTEGLADRLLGPDWRTRGALGETIRMANRSENTDLTITGVIEDVPEASTLQFEWVMAAADFYARNAWVEEWGNSGMRLFVRLQPSTDLDAVNAKIKDLIRENNEEANADLFLQPFKDVRLHNRFERAQLVGGRIELVRIFLVVAIFVLLIACVNFMNLATARSAKRAREIGVRKAVGASRSSLVRQFLGESLMLALGAFVVAVGLVVALLPLFNELTAKEMTLASIDGGILALFFGIAVATGLLAGSYPAVFLSGFNVSRVLRGSGRAYRGPHAGLRKGLVVVQFALSILLVIGTLATYRQMAYIQTKNLGLDKENLVYMTLEGGMKQQYDAVKADLLARPGIVSVTSSSQNPLSVGNSTDSPEWDGKDPDDQILFHIINGGYDFIETMGMNLLAGRAFSPSFGADSSNLIINQRAAEAMGMDDPIGQRIAMWGHEGEVVGLVEDFHMTSLHDTIEPTFIRLYENSAWMLFVRTEPGQTQEAIASLGAVQAQFNPGLPFEYNFLGADYAETYETEFTIGRLANAFAVLALFIACLGLFGLAAYSAEQRRKEIGIRKVMGASVPNLVGLLTKEFVVLVAVAFAVAAPAAYFLMDAWLDDFAYRTVLGADLFILAGIGALAVAWLTVSYQSYRTAVGNPVTALRSE